ncbi:hypothetical protein [Rhodococcus maanshanensis]|nr:hypothetical protein [Rhodococcus maanshanensis]
MNIDFDNQIDYPGEACTLGALGTDSAGRKIGITAGHCNPWNNDAVPPEGFGPVPINKGAPRGVEVAGNDHPVYDRRLLEVSKSAGIPPNPLSNPSIGQIRWVDPHVCQQGETGPGGLGCLAGYGETSANSRTDYMIIEFDPAVELWSGVYNKNGQPVQAPGGGLFKVNSIYSDASGAPALPPVSSQIVTFGAKSDRTPNPGPFGMANEVAPSEGSVHSYIAPGMIRTRAGSQPGDSGGPVIARGTNKWVAIITATPYQWYQPPQHVVTSAKNILDAINDPNRPGTIGRGFTITNNPNS